MREIKKHISHFLREMLSESIDREPKNKLIAKFLINLALDEEQPVKLRLESVEMIMDRVEGKAVNTNLNADISENPFDGIDTLKLEVLRAKLIEIKKL